MILAIILVFLPVAVLVHEGTHYVLYTLEGIEVTSFHVLDQSSFERGSAGYITFSKESRFGPLFQEAIANIITLLFLVFIVVICLLKPLKRFTVQQCEVIGIQRKNQLT
jgi:hypothetical protein